MVSNSVSGAIMISIVDMILLISFLYIIGLFLKCLPLINKISFGSKEGK